MSSTILGIVFQIFLQKAFRGLHFYFLSPHASKIKFFLLFDIFSWLICVPHDEYISPNIFSILYSFLSYMFLPFLVSFFLFFPQRPELWELSHDQGPLNNKANIHGAFLCFLLLKNSRKKSLLYKYLTGRL